MKRLSVTKQNNHQHVKEVLTTLNKFHLIGIKHGTATLNPIFQDTYLKSLVNDPFEQKKQLYVIAGSPEHIALKNTQQQQNTTFDSSVDQQQQLQQKQPYVIKPDKRPPNSADVENFARGQWESVLQFMHSPSVDGYNNRFSAGIRQLLEWSHLVRGREDDSSSGGGSGSGGGGGLDESSTRSRITTEGFQFLLLDTKTQVWKLLKQYIDTAEKRQMSRIEILQFMFELSFMQCGKGYPVKPLTKTQRVMLVDLADLGLIYQRKQKSKWFYPTPLSIGLTSAGSSDGSSMDGSGSSSGSVAKEGVSIGGHIIVETNFRVYAYTNSPLQISLLCLFIVPEYRLPNMVVGLITRESVREALIHGITAEQILSYLTIYAHPHMRRKKPVLPDVVAHQVRLWEMERKRFKLFPAVHYDKFPSLEKFRMAEEYSKRIGAHLWSSETSMKLITKRETHEKMALFIKQNM